MISLATKITLLRLILTPIIVVLLVMECENTTEVACALFIIASFTDYLDGHIARKQNTFTDLGAILDPIADKLLVVAVIFTLATKGNFQGIMLVPALVTVLREIFISALRELTVTTKTRMESTVLSKWKTAVQMFAIYFIIMDREELGMTLFWLSSALSIITCYGYCIQMVFNLKSQSKKISASSE